MRVRVSSPRYQTISLWAAVPPAGPKVRLPMITSHRARTLTMARLETWHSGWQVRGHGATGARRRSRYYKFLLNRVKSTVVDPNILSPEIDLLSSKKMLVRTTPAAKHGLFVRTIVHQPPLFTSFAQCLQCQLEIKRHFRLPEETGSFCIGIM